jgi:hypothetical protein
MDALSSDQVIEIGWHRPAQARFSDLRATQRPVFQVWRQSSTYGFDFR